MHLEGLWLPRWRSDTEAHLHYVKKVLYSGQSDYQKIDIVEFVGYGRCLMLDGVHQFSEKDQFIYQEAISHTALFLHPHPQVVLIIGGASGSTLNEVLKHPTITKVVIIDIDQLVVEKCREYLGFDEGAYNDKRVELIYDDAAKYIAKTEIQFDCIIIDSTPPKPGSIAYSLYGEEFYNNCYNALNVNGVLSGLQSNANILFVNSHRSIRNMLSGIFEDVHSYMVYCPFYAISYLFVLAIKSHKVDPLEVGSMEDRVKDLENKLKFYDIETHLHMFHLPKYIRSIIFDTGPNLEQEQLTKY